MAGSANFMKWNLKARINGRKTQGFLVLRVNIPLVPFCIVEHLSHQSARFAGGWWLLL
jgi:hypothetical protein